MIAIVYPQFYGVGGIARYIESFLQNLPADAPPVILITGTEHQRPADFAGVEIIHVPFSSNRLALLSWALRVRRLLGQLHRDERIQLVNFHWPPLIPGLLLPRGIPLVLTAHTTYCGMSGRFYPQHHFDSQWSAASLAIKMWMERRVFARTQKVITLTEQGRQEVLSYGYGGPIAVIPNGADTRKFNPDRAVVDDIDLLFSGRIEQRKGSRMLPEVCRQVLRARPSTRICVVGYGEDAQWLGGQLQSLGPNVQMTGKVDFQQMTDYYNRSRVYASTSYYEGLPGTCLEAMAMELPVVVWDFLFYRGLVDDGESGWVVPPNDCGAMARRIVSLLADRDAAERMGRKGRGILERGYDWRKLASDVLAVMRAP